MSGIAHEIAHGGAVDAAAERYGVPRNQWLDLSTGINPTPYPLPSLARDYWYRLPDRGLETWLRDAAAQYYGVDDARAIVPAPGTQALIQWLPRLFERCRVTVIGPTYGEHALAWTQGGHVVGEVASADQVPSDSAVVVVVNPNNPNGRIIDADRLLLLARDRTVIVDEAFADVTPEVSVSGHVTSPACRGRLIVLRSIGKFFGLAGMRLGFALVDGALSEKLRRALGPWAVSGPAAAVGAVALQDDAWIRAARVRLTATSGRLDGLLVRNGFDVIGGTALFRLVEHPRAADLFEHLAQAAILARAFDHRPLWLRFGLPGNDGEFERLAKALSHWRPRAAASTMPGTRKRI